MIFEIAATISYGPGYMAPEVFYGRRYSFPADVYTWALTMRDLLAYNWVAPTQLQTSDFSGKGDAKFNRNTFQRASKSRFAKDLNIVLQTTCLNL